MVKNCCVFEDRDFFFLLKYSTTLKISSFSKLTSEDEVKKQQISSCASVDYFFMVVHSAVSLSPEYFQQNTFIFIKSLLQRNAGENWES